MTDTQSEKIDVTVAMDFSDDIMNEIRAVSPRLHVERHFPNVPDRVWTNTEVLYSLYNFPTPEQAPHLRWIQMHTAGIEHALKERIMLAEDVTITTASGIHVTQVAELTLSMMLAFIYRLPLLMEHKARAEWSDDRDALFSQHELRGSTIGIVGYGSLGREIARLSRAFGMRVLATKRQLMDSVEHEGYTETGTGDPEGKIPDRLYPPEALASMARECDFVVLTVPLTETTRHMVDERIFDAMKPTAYLINMARGGVVDEKALINALAADKIAGAGLDVFEEEPLPPGSPLWNLDNVIISPHVGGFSATLHRRAAGIFIENLGRYLENRPLLNVFDRERGY